MCVCVCVCACACAYVWECVYFQAVQPHRHTCIESCTPTQRHKNHWFPVSLQTNNRLVKRQTQKPLTASQLTTKTNTRFRLMWWIKESDVWRDLDGCWIQVRCLCELMKHAWPWVLSIPINTSSYTRHAFLSSPLYQSYWICASCWY